VIDLKLLRDDPERVRDSQRARGDDPALVDALLAADEARRAAVTRADGLRADQKAVSQSVKKASAEERPAVLERAKALAAEVKAAEAAQSEAEAALRAAQLAVPNVVEGSPPGGEQDFVVLEQIGEVPAYDFAVRDHLDVGAALGPAGRPGDRHRARRQGQRQPVRLPHRRRRAARAGAGQPGHGARRGGGLRPHHHARARAPGVDGGHRLPGRSRVGGVPARGRRPVPGRHLRGAAGALHSGEVLDALPLRYAGFSSCFRREAGSHGKDTRGIIRVHQFDKVEMFSFVDPADADAEHQRLLAHEKAFLSALELPFRVIDVAAGDLGSSAARKFDCEAWLPSQERWLELTSTSNCTTFQARRLGIRSRVGGSPPRSRP
jgi:seryl-tRNA synthetase